MEIGNYGRNKKKDPKSANNACFGSVLAGALNRNRTDDLILTMDAGDIP